MVSRFKLLKKDRYRAGPTTGSIAKNEDGLSLIEMVVTIAIVAIITYSGLSFYIQMLRQMTNLDKSIDLKSRLYQIIGEIAQRPEAFIPLKGRDGYMSYIYCFSRSGQKALNRYGTLSGILLSGLDPRKVTVSGYCSRDTIFEVQVTYDSESTRIQALAIEIDPNSEGPKDWQAAYLEY